MRISDWSSDVCSSDLVGGGNINNAFTYKDLDVLEHSGRLYVDLSAQYAIIDDGDRKVSLFAGISNLLDNDPPITGTGGFATVRSLYDRSEEHTSELQSLMRSTYAVFCLKKHTNTQTT